MEKQVLKRVKEQDKAYERKKLAWGLISRWIRLR